MNIIQTARQKKCFDFLFKMKHCIDYRISCNLTTVFSHSNILELSLNLMRNISVSVKYLFSLLLHCIISHLRSILFKHWKNTLYVYILVTWYSIYVIFLNFCVEFIIKQDVKDLFVANIENLLCCFYKIIYWVKENTDANSLKRSSVIALQRRHRVTLI